MILSSQNIKVLKTLIICALNNNWNKHIYELKTTLTWVLIDTPLNNTQQMYDIINHFLYLRATCMPDTPNSRKWTAEIRRSTSIPYECSTPTEARRHKQEYLSAVDSRTTAFYCSTTRATAGLWCGQSKAIALLNNTAPARTCLQLLDRFWCASALRLLAHNIHSGICFILLYTVYTWSELCALVNKPSGASAGASDLKY